MKICFVLPRYSRKPIGGFGVIYQYACGLVRDNDVYMLYLNEDIFVNYPLPRALKKIGGVIMTFFEPRWFGLDKRIRKMTLKTPHLDRIMNEMDTVICTAIETVGYVRDLDTSADKAYFIQDFENWSFPDEYVYESYGLGFKNIVVSSWLKELVDEHAKLGSYLVKNPVDTRIYRVKTPVDERKKHTIALLYHGAAYKGLNYAFEALDKLKEIYDDIEVKMFGTTVPDRKLPGWIKFTYNASSEETVSIYNSVQVFMCATVREGFGLTGLEAMACGDMLVSTDYEGVREYAVNNVNAMLSPVEDVDALVRNVCLAFDDAWLRKELINEGLKTVSSDFDPEDALKQFTAALKE
ncbi:MAG: glycosyltransferase family 4 protein [Lachnospiraceae bacterium]|nr:glycosyltransferase family 4 protein [Lachnospiraceae bacterium]